MAMMAVAITVEAMMTMMMIIKHVDDNNDDDDNDYDEYDYNDDDDDHVFHSKINNASRNALSLICRNHPICISLIFMRLWACYTSMR